MTTTRRFLVLASALAGFAMILAAPQPVDAQAQARVLGTVVDPEGNPVAGVQVRVTSPDLAAFEMEAESNKRGRVTVMLIDATLNYFFEFHKEGLQSFKEPVKATPGTTMEREFRFPAEAAAAAATSTATQELTGRGKAVRVFNDGVEALRRGDTATAEAKWKEAAAEDPSIPQPRSALATLYGEQGKHAEAIAEADQALAIDPSDIAAMTVRFDAFRALGDDEGLREATERLLTIEQGDTNVAIRIYNFGAQATGQGDATTAERMFRKAVELDPSIAQAHAALSSVLLHSGRAEEALPVADTALSLDAGNTMALKVRYDALTALGREEEAKAAYAQITAADPSGVVSVLVERGTEHFNAGQMQEARTSFEEALAIDSNQPQVHYLLALCYVNTGESAKAKAHFESFLALAPDSPDAATAREMMAYLN